MAAEVIRLVPDQIAQDFRLDADAVLEEAKGLAHVTLVILAENEDGELYMRGNANSGEALILMEKAKRMIVFGEE